MKQNETNAPKTQEGSGSAENLGRDRSEQKQPEAASDQQGMEEAASRQHLVNLHDMGSVSGHDDHAGGSGDRMENESTGEATER